MKYGLETRNIHIFLEEYGITNEQGIKLDFFDHPFLWDVYTDLSPKQVIFKAAQIGFSTLAVIKSLWIAKNKGMDIIYTLPTESDRNEFVSGKVNRIIAQNPILQEWTKDKDAIEQKKLGNNLLYYRGCFDEDTDVLTYDGWKNNRSLSVGESLPTLDLATMTIHRDKVLDVSCFDVDEEVITLKGKGIDAVLTNDHRCVVFNRSGALKIERANKITRHTLVPSRWNKPESVYCPESELIGWIISEGSFWTERYKNKFVKKSGTVSKKMWKYQRISIIQKKYSERLRKCLIDAKVSFYEKRHGSECIRFELSRKDSKRYFELLNGKKELSFAVINKIDMHSLESLFNGLLFGDGNKNKTFFYQKSKETVDAFQFLCVLLGHASNAVLRDFSIQKNRFSRKSCYRVTVRQTKSITGINTGTVIKKGIMWCPTTQKGTVFVRRNGKVYVTGQTWTQKSAIMIPSDLNIYDEVDASKQDVVEQYSTRLQHSKYKWEWYFSHPSATGSGVDRYWARSDQKHWFIRCPNCKKEHYLEFPKSIDQTKKVFICKLCRTELSDDDRRNGRWVKRYPGREFSGYWIPLLICPWVSADEILSYQRNKTEEYFMNKVLGLPYVGGGNKLSKAHFLQNLTSENLYPDKNDRVVLGMDTGKQLHYVIGTQKGLFYYGTAKDYDEIEELMARWTRMIVVIDQGGDLIGSRKLREKYLGRVFLCSYGEDRKTKELIRWGKHDEHGAVIADRNRTIQLIVDEFTDRRIPVQGEESDWYDYWLHWNNLTRVKEVDPKTGSVKRRIWVRSGDDHWAHATAYWRIGMDRFGGAAAVTNKNVLLEKIPEESKNMFTDDEVRDMFRQKKKTDWRL